MSQRSLENGILLTGDLREELKGMVSGCVQTVITSPPYYSLRDYGTPSQIWGGHESCNHDWGKTIPGDNRGGSGTATDKSGYGEGYGRSSPRGAFCRRCSAWSGQLGLEPTLDLYVEHMVEVFRSVREVLNDTGTLWLNLGDSYASIPSWGKGEGSTLQGRKQSVVGGPSRSLSGFKAKDLMMAPFRVAMALQMDGWYLRSVCPWIKGSCLPESVKDRPTSAIEYWFLLSKSPRYYYDIRAVKLGAKNASSGNSSRTTNGSSVGFPIENNHGRSVPWKNDGKGRQRRNSDWFFDSTVSLRDHLNEILYGACGPIVLEDEIQAFYVNPEGFKGAHFATFATKLIEPMILASTSQAGGCTSCFMPFSRKPGSEEWEPICGCDGAKPYPQVVLDPFGGSGTVGVVSETLGRRWRLCELKEEYVDMAAKRIASHCRRLEGLTEEDQKSDQLSLFF